MDCLEKEDALFLSLLFLYYLGWLCDGINSLTVLMSGVWIRGGFFQGFFVWLIRAKGCICTIHIFHEYLVYVSLLPRQRHWYIEEGLNKSWQYH